MADFLAFVLLLVAVIVPASPDPRETKAGFREKIPCIDSGKFYRNPNGDPRLANRKKDKVLAYAQRVLQSCGPPPCARGVDGMLEITITEEARATLEELQDSINVVMPEAGAFA